ncbi:sodium/glutamate symporter [Sporomusa termitida]|uniref:Sodium/glutamate symporter n=1 Tax=Sporomusa termitida TaxID=2377 RepID=A0A517DQQ8_9FIRM|nr:sodium/glutamate symporter [Sporomusa termitida]QDR79693.1 Sodium/glutamate symporter [Sporomusa termitida]
MPFGPYTMLLDFCIVAGLLFVGQLLRAKLRIIQNLYLPASVIAGVLGILLGSQFLNILPFSNNIGSYPYMLVVVLFATLFLGNEKMDSPKKVVSEVGDTFSYSMIAEIGQFGIALLFGILVFKQFFPDLHHAFALMLPAGWAGGYGYATAIGGVLQNYGFKDALTVGFTMATAGMLSGIFGGLLFINIATRLGITRFVKAMAKLPESMKTGLIPPEERKPIGMGTVSSGCIDPLAWHLVLVLIAAACGYYSNQYFKVIMPKYDVPMMCLSMLAGVLLQLLLNRMNLGQYVDKQVTTRIGSCVTDFMVCFGIASIKISIVAQYAVPLILLCILGFVWCGGFLWFLGPRMFHNYWFERALFCWGWATGVVATGVTLLRIIDPEFRSKALQDYGLAYIFIAVVEIFLVSLTPVFVGLGYVGETAAVLIGVSLFIFVLSIKAGYWYNPNRTELRPGEEKINM